VLSRNQIMDELWPNGNGGIDGSLNNLISSIRKYLTTYGYLTIETITNEGYYIK